MFHTIGAIGGRFLRDTRGGATSIAAVFVIFMTLGGAALIVDHNHLVGQRDILKSAADAASVAATLHLGEQPSTMSDADAETAITSFARKYAVLNVLGNVNDAAITAEDVTITFDMDRGTNTVNATVAADTGKTLIAHWLYGYSGPGTVTTFAGVERVDSTTEIVLAIDVSLSMKRNLEGDDVGHSDPDSRLSIVKQAAIDLVGVVQPSAENRVAVGVVPWDLWVRLDPTLRASWTAKSWATYPKRRYFGAPYECQPVSTCTPTSSTDDLRASAPGTWAGCLDEHRVTGDLADLTPETDWFEHPSTKAFAQAIYPSEFGVAYACLDSPLPGDLRTQNCYARAAAGIPAWRVSGRRRAQERCQSDRPSILPLSTEQTDIVEYIEAMAPGGAETHSALGLLWGQRLLTPEWRDAWGDNTYPVDRGANVRKAIVLLTDGNDTQCGEVDTDCSITKLGYDRAEVCEDIKEAGSEIFVVAAMPPSEVTGDLGTGLTDCSSQGDRPGTYTFLNNSDAAALRAAFTSIATQLRAVRRIY